MANKPDIYNIYPVFLKVLKDMETDTFLDESFKLYTRLKNTRPPTDYYTRLTRCLTSFIRSTYDSCCMNGAGPELFEQYKDSSIELIKYGKYKLIFLRSKDKLIFLNYADENEILEHSTKSFLPRNIPNSSIHFHKMVSGRKTYTVVNTHDAFVGYGRLHNNKKNVTDDGSYIKIDLNAPFFDSFKRSVREEDLEAGSTYQHCDDVDESDNRFLYYVYKDLIIIIDYYDHFMDGMNKLANSNNDDYLFEY